MPNKEIYTDNIEIRQRLDARTPGKWVVGFSDGYGKFELPYHGAYIVADEINIVIWGGENDGFPVGIIKQEDADFIAHAPDDMRRLLEKQDVLKGILDIAFKIILDMTYCEIPEEIPQKVYKRLCLMEEILNNFKEKYENE